MDIDLGIESVIQINPYILLLQGMYVSDRARRDWSITGQFLLPFEGTEWLHWTKSPKRSSGSARRSRASMHNARSSLASSASWMQRNECLRATARVRRSKGRGQGRRPPRL